VNPELVSASTLLPNRNRHPMTRSNATQRLALAVAAAIPAMPSLRGRRISPHTVRHTTAMHLLQSGERIDGVALWMGHESPATTHQYTQADLAMKEKARAKLQDPDTPAKRFKATDSLLEFLKTRDCEQIADELVEAGRRVYLCVGRHQRVPRRYRGHDSFWWRRELGMLDETAAEVPPERRLPPPLVTGVHGGYDVDLRHSAARGLSLLGHLRGIDGDRMYFADDLDAQLRVGDRSLDEFLARVDQHIERTGLDAPSAPERTHRSPPPIHSPAQLDVRGERIGSVVWATGYDRDFSWVELPVLDPAGAPIHTRGVTAMQGLYFLGMPWLYTRKSTFLAGVGEDAGFIADAIAGAGEQTQG
jgi:hypothetical protein